VDRQQRNRREVGKAILKFHEGIKHHVRFEDAVMDVLYTPDEEVKLIEFNPLETSGGGLFSWRKDKDLLAGKKRTPVLRYVVFEE